MHEEESPGLSRELVIGRAHLVEDRCIIPVVRFLVVCRSGGALVQTTPIALLIAEGDEEYIALLPGARTPEMIREIIASFREDIEREKQSCRAQAPSSR